MSKGLTDNKSLAESMLLRVADDHYDAIQIISKCPECFEAYKSLIQKKRVASKDGGLAVETSQHEKCGILNVTGTTR